MSAALRRLFIKFSRLFVSVTVSVKFFCLVTVYKMDSSEIDRAIDDDSDFTDSSVSGSEYVPSDNLIDSDNDVTSVGLSDECVESDGNDIGHWYHNQVEEEAGSTESEVEDDPVQAVVSDIHNDFVRNLLEWTEFKQSCRQYPFNAESGLTRDCQTDEPFKVFSQFVDDEILNLIVTETNRYAHQYLSKKRPKKRSPMRKWVDCTIDEIKKLLGILMIMGICPMPQRKMYWSKNPMYGNQVIKRTMTRDRFDCLMKCLHFHNNEAPDSSEPRLAKIKNLVSLLNMKFRELLVPDENLVIDESMVPWRGRLIFRQYLPGKSHKYGVKLYKLCSTHGYTFKTKVYAGKSDILANEGHADKVVMELMENELQAGRTLYADNFYNSVKLASLLLENKTYLCGTLRVDRKENPKVVVNEKLSKGEMIAKENSSGVKCMKWRDKRVVMMISTRPEDTDTLVKSTKRNKKGDIIMKPTSVLAYNQAKKGVDFSDQMASYYTPLRKSLAWYKKVALEILLGTSVVNAFVVCNQFGSKKTDMLQFREKIIEQLLTPESAEEEGTTSDVVNGTPGAGRANSRKRKHELTKLEGPVRKNRKRCVFCYKDMVKERDTKTARKLAKRVVTFCNECEGNPFMCIQCFNKNH